MPAPQSARSKDQSTVRRLTELNAALNPDSFTLREMEKLISANPDRIRIVSEETESTIYASDIVFREALLRIKGFSKDSLADLRDIGFVPRKLSREHFYFGRHIIALFEGNLRVLIRQEELRRRGTAGKRRKKS